MYHHLKYKNRWAILRSSRQIYFEVLPVLWESTYIQLEMSPRWCSGSSQRLSGLEVHTFVRQVRNLSLYIVFSGAGTGEAELATDMVDFVNKCEGVTEVTFGLEFNLRIAAEAVRDEMGVLRAIRKKCSFIVKGKPGALDAQYQDLVKTLGTQVTSLSLKRRHADGAQDCERVA